MKLRVLALASTLLTLACAPESGSLSCNNPSIFICASTSITNGTLTNATCLNGAVSVASCPTIGIIGRCTAPGLLGGIACPSGSTCTQSFVLYTGGDTTAGQAACMAINGTWTAL